MSQPVLDVRLGPHCLQRGGYATALTIPGQAGFKVLAPADMVLHSAVHLFYDGDFVRGLRDLADLDALLRHFAPKASFWRSLLDSARIHDVERPQFYALCYSIKLLGTPNLKESPVCIPPARHGLATGAGFTLAPFHLYVTRLESGAASALYTISLVTNDTGSLNPPPVSQGIHLQVIAGRRWWPGCVAISTLLAENGARGRKQNASIFSMSVR